MENCPDLSGRLKDLKFFSEEKKKSMSQSKRFFYQLQELARTSKRPIFYGNVTINNNIVIIIYNI
jgi:hypothetical protein